MYDDVTRQLGGPEKGRRPNGTPQPPTEIAGGADGRSGDFENTDASGSPASNSGLDEAAGAALEDLARALEQAGIALQSAGATLSENGSGEFDEDTEAAMTDANIAVLVAEQALEAAIASTDNPTAGMTAEISDAARLIILANRVLSEAQGSPNDGRLADDTMILGAPSGTDRLGELDAELEASLAIFESEIQGSRDAVASIFKVPLRLEYFDPSPRQRLARAGIRPRHPNRWVYPTVPLATSAFVLDSVNRPPPSAKLSS